VRPAGRVIGRNAAHIQPERFGTVAFRSCFGRMTIARAVPILAALLALAACSSQKDEQLMAVKSARSGGG
jgi:hypothetical protein